RSTRRTATTSRGYNSASAPASEAPHMTTVQGLALAAALAALALPAGAQQAQPQSKFGFVNTERILRDATPAVRAQKKIEAEFQKRDQELAKVAELLKRLQDEFDKTWVTMSENRRLYR